VTTALSYTLTRLPDVNKKRHGVTADPVRAVRMRLSLSHLSFLLSLPFMLVLSLQYDSFAIVSVVTVPVTMKILWNGLPPFLTTARAPSRFMLT
jgi:hypothetical protein